MVIFKRLFLMQIDQTQSLTRHISRLLGRRSIRKTMTHYMHVYKLKSLKSFQIRKNLKFQR